MSIKFNTQEIRVFRNVSRTISYLHLSNLLDVEKDKDLYDLLLVSFYLSLIGHAVGNIRQSVFNELFDVHGNVETNSTKRFELLMDTVKTLITKDHSDVHDLIKNKFFHVISICPILEIFIGCCPDLLTYYYLANKKEDEHEAYKFTSSRLNDVMKSLSNFSDVYRSDRTKENSMLFGGAMHMFALFKNGLKYVVFSHQRLIKDTSVFEATEEDIKATSTDCIRFFTDRPISVAVDSVFASMFLLRNIIVLYSIVDIDFKNKYVPSYTNFIVNRLRKYCNENYLQYFINVSGNVNSDEEDQMFSSSSSSDDFS